jgi:hypothetical protein
MEKCTVIECGKRKYVKNLCTTHYTRLLKHGNTTTVLKAGGKPRHGMANTRTYRIWTGMKQRCNNKNATDYYKYGKLGIKVCDRWLKFDNFIEDMGICPDQYTIDRENSSGDYEPNNCKWATYIEQNAHLSIRSDNKTGHPGVIFDKERKKFRVEIQRNYVKHYIGRYDTLKEAVEAHENYFKEN